MSRAIVVEALWRVTWWGLRSRRSAAGSSGSGADVPALLLLALIVVPLVELYVVVQVGQGLGVLPTLALLLVVSLLGAALLRREGARTWRAFRGATAAGRVPAGEVVEGAVVLFAGALLLTPGFVTDAVGLLLLLPPVRVLVRRSLTAYAGRRLLGGVGGLGGLSGGRGSARRGGRVVDGEVVDPDDGPRGHER